MTRAELGLTPSKLETMRRVMEADGLRKMCAYWKDAAITLASRIDAGGVEGAVVEKTVAHTVVEDGLVLENRQLEEMAAELDAIAQTLAHDLERATERCRPVLGLLQSIRDMGCPEGDDPVVFIKDIYSAYCGIDDLERQVNDATEVLQAHILYTEAIDDILQRAISALIASPGTSVGIRFRDERQALQQPKGIGP